MGKMRGGVELSKVGGYYQHGVLCRVLKVLLMRGINGHPVTINYILYIVVLCYVVDPR